MMTLFGDPAVWLPVTFAGLMGLSILIYVVLDGYDLGVGLLMSRTGGSDSDRMIAAIGPFWDANETWLVLAVGLLLVAFPVAHGAILSGLYLPVAIMLIGLILRGVAFEFRAKVPPAAKPRWNAIFVTGSAMTALSQGFMLGLYVLGLEWSLGTVFFGLLIAACLGGAYALVGACWLIVKIDGDLQRRAIGWARKAAIATALGMAAISIATPLASGRLFAKWFSVPEVLLLAPLPIVTVGLFIALGLTLNRAPLDRAGWAWVPFSLTVGIFALGFVGLAYSFYPYVVPESLTIYEAAAAPESLAIILVGTLFVLPVILAYSALSYFIFRGKATTLSYD